MPLSLAEFALLRFFYKIFTRFPPSVRHDQTFTTCLNESINPSINRDILFCASIVLYSSCAKSSVVYNIDLDLKKRNSVSQFVRYYGISFLLIAVVVPP